jgi:cytidylate kinase
MTSIEAIINRQLLKWELQRQKPNQPDDLPSPVWPIVTVSRQSGSRGSYFASRLASRLDYQRLHRDVIDKICQSSGLRKRIISALDDKVVSQLELLAESILSGQSIDHSDYLKHLTRVLLSMSHLGGVILMGRGGSFILGRDRGFHIRFVAPRAKRIENLMKYCDYEELEAGEFVDRSDHERAIFIRKLFNADIDDPSNYDMVVNSEFMDVEDMVEVVAMAVNAKQQKLAYLEHDEFES